jgi:hypothetical protein
MIPQVALGKIMELVKGGRRPTIPKWVSPFWSEMLQKCWSDDKKQRPSFEEIEEEISKGDTLLPPDLHEQQMKLMKETKEAHKKALVCCTFPLS